MWLFTTKCPFCRHTNERYSVLVHDQSHPDCLGITCNCGYTYVAVSNAVKCIGCGRCIWVEDHGFHIKVLNQNVSS